MKRDFYESPKPTAFMKFFWKASGGDQYILERSTYSDQVKYMCLGGIIIATGLMAGLAGGYAFYTIFETRGSALESTFDLQTTILAVIFGAFWGLMIFNLDRFIVSSTGKGDGTEAITWEEFKGAIPRLILGSIIALTISKPIEIRMFKSEIDAALHSEQMQEEKRYELEARALFTDRMAPINSGLEKIEIERSDLLERIKKAEKEYIDQLQGRTGAAGAGNGPLSRALEKIKLGLINDLNNFDENHKERKNKLLLEKIALNEEMESSLAKNQTVAHGLDGLLQRIKLAHEVAGFWISLFITLLFLAIELTPIFFKLMLVKSPYDFLKDNVEELMKAEQGIHIEYNYHKDKEGQERDLVRHLSREKLLVEKLALQKVQQELVDYALLKYAEEQKKKIDENPSFYVKVIDDNGPDDINHTHTPESETEFA